MKYLIISHDATRTGAPILLLNLAKLILKNEPNSVSFLLKRGGGLESDFKALGPTFFVSEKVSNSLFSKFSKNNKVVIEDSNFLNKFEIIISNTITNGDILHKIRANFKGKIISYIHELEIASKTYTTPAEIARVIDCSDFFWVPSTLVNDFLVDELKISQDLIQIMPYFIPYDNLNSSNTFSDTRKFTIGGCGTADWRKGPDLFVLIAKNLLLKYPESKIQFKWIGALDQVRLDRMRYQIKKADIEEFVTFEGSVSDVSDFYNSIDLFLLTSREDPYPLVILESASYSVPSICFDKVCGSKDFIVNANGGSIVPFINIDVMIETIMKYYDDKEFRNEKGSNARKFLLNTHSNEDYVYTKFINFLKN